MSTRHLAPVAQYREPRNSAAAAILAPAYVTLAGDGVYEFSTTGPADAYLVDAGDGVLVIDPAATAQAAGVRLTAAGDTTYLYGAP